MLRKRLKLGVLINASGSHVAGWRHPDAHPDATSSLQHYLGVAKKAEEGRFDIVFFADSAALYDGTPAHQERNAAGLAGTEPKRHLEPFTLLAAIAAHTRHIGLVGSATTTYFEPFHVARKVASLDHISGGRAGWNLVTSANPAEATNFNREQHVPHAERYERAAEFVDVVKSLWDSVDDGAYVRDKESGRYADLSRVHPIGHVGKHFSVTGPLNVSRPPQGHPVIAQAGSSDVGRELAAVSADLVFTAQRSLSDGQAFYQDLKSRVREHGRDPEHVLVLPGLVPFVGRSEAEARETFEALQAKIQPEVGLALIAELLGEIDLTGLPLDAPLPEIIGSDGSKSRFDLLKRLAEKGGLTIRQLYEQTASASGHGFVIGSPAQVADYIETWFREGAADGFNILPPYLPGGFNDFVDLVVPELQKRGLVQEAYLGGTLRSQLGLPRPVGRFGVSA
ncbi:LLM class flavin-dependent oxidoreductase [Zoogloea sp. LCSB751]|uniref:LLM class flavin-dependent oxidoreductase n=1 Tax=Zoogloea sp. LCSB751 TaxID=1965277 RepID=UPI0009A530D2|nr:LLM class flavin-dependent oxidoreductase [Zoogloea sp. LCSB751]